jgi:hypothetical protein
MDGVAAHRVATQFEALLFERVLAPLDTAFGETGAMLAPPLAEALAERERGFATLLTQLLERSHD